MWRRALLVLVVACVVVDAAPALVLVTGTGTLSCATWLKAREESNDEQTALMVQWIAGFAVSYNYYNSAAPGNKQLQVNLDHIKYFTDKYCRDNPLLVSMMPVAAEYVEQLGGAKGFHNRIKRKSGSH
jgi:hypothetical protein